MKKAIVICALALGCTAVFAQDQLQPPEPTPAADTQLVAQDVVLAAPLDVTMADSAPSDITIADSAPLDIAMASPAISDITIAGTSCDNIEMPPQLASPAALDALQRYPDRLTAGLLAILLGTFGVQHFYTEQTGRGVLDLLFCWTGIPTVIGIIEGVIWLCESDEDFADRAYYW